jgi:hypothetical protein
MSIDVKDIHDTSSLLLAFRVLLLCSLCYWDIFFVLLLVKTELFLNNVTVLQQHTAY